MAENLQYCIKLLDDNDENVRRDAQQILLRLCDNILKFPNESKYRRIKLSSTVVSTKLLPAAGAIECLFEVGFVENDDEFLLPANASLLGIERLHSLLSNVQKPVSIQSPKINFTPEPSTSASTETTEIKYTKGSFFDRITNFYKGVMRYEDKDLQNKARALLPLETIQIAAIERLRNVQREIKLKKIPDNNIVYEDMLLAELLNWFKNKFFKWVNSPACKSCMGECVYDRAITSPNPNVSRIEIHKCKNCRSETEFPRYTDPEDLLRSRKGRCGEWANCFTLICRSVGFDARIVYDETDHVWTEVWSVAHDRWIHADPCENEMDRPLLYEKGWGKKLSYVIAFSRDEVQDVTWRYTRNYHEVMRRRKIVSEEALATFIGKLNSIRQSPDQGYSSARKKFVNRRSAFELAAMLTAPPGCKKPGEVEDEAEYGGRTSGSLAWRTSRGETGTANFEPTRWTIPQGIKSYELSYYILSDSYTIRDAETGKVIKETKQWQSGIEENVGGVFLNRELDWQMVYLARTNASSPGKVTWTFVVEDKASMYFDSVHLQAITKTFHGGTIQWEIKGTFDSKEEELKVVNVDSSENFATKYLKGAMKISVSVTLAGSEGDTAWQHAQLFRTSLNESSAEPSLVIKINLTDK